MKRKIKDIETVMKEGYLFNQRSELVKDRSKLFPNCSFNMFLGQIVSVKDDGLTITENLRPTLLDNNVFDGEVIKDEWNRVEVFTNSNGNLAYSVNGKDMKEFRS